MRVAKKVPEAPKKRKISKKKLVTAKAKPKRVKRVLRVLKPVPPAVLPKVVPEHPLLRHSDNPILRPAENSGWETKAVFNPAAVYEGGKVHLLYRAIGDDDISMLGYAVSDDGRNFERATEPAYIVDVHGLGRKDKMASQPVSSSGGGWSGGCEDPRLTFIDDNAYLFYVAFNGWDSIRVGMSSIAKDDFLNQRWNWRPQILLSPEGEIHKNWVLFPRKIRGKFAILHSLSPEVLIEYVDDLESIEAGSIKSVAGQRKWSPLKSWDRRIRGIGPPPIYTDKGWLVLYHANGADDPHLYKLGAMLLDLDDPTKVVARSNEPILVPDECYENEGIKPGIVYCCGAIVKDGRLTVYYGGADTVVCAASTNLEKFLAKLVNAGVPKLKAVAAKPYAARKKVSK